MTKGAGREDAASAASPTTAPRPGDWVDFVESILVEHDFPDAAALARATGISASTISSWKRGATKPAAPPGLRQLVEASGRAMKEALIAAGIVTPEEMDEPVPERRTSLSAYTDAEIMQEAQRRMQQHIESGRNHGR